MPLVSIVTPVFNSQRFLLDTLESVRAQSFSDWEHVCVVDPKSSDASERMLCEWALNEGRLRLHRAEKPGPSHARNLGLAQARGRYVAFLDSDDLWLPQKLELQIAAMRSQNVALSCTAFRRISANGRRLGRLVAVPARISRARLRQQNCLLCSSVIVDREQFDPFQFADIGCEDFALWLELLRHVPVALGVQADLVRYRIVPGSRGSNPWRSLVETWSIYRRQERLSLLAAAGLMLPFMFRVAAKHARF